VPVRARAPTRCGEVGGSCVSAASKDISSRDCEHARNETNKHKHTRAEQRDALHRVSRPRPPPQVDVPFPSVSKEREFSPPIRDAIAISTAHTSARGLGLGLGAAP
jgi:hypothetical protein